MQQGPSLGPLPFRGGLQSPSPRRPSLCAAVRETGLSLGTGVPSLPASPPKGTGLGTGLAGSLRNTLQPLSPPSLGPLRVSCSLLPSGVTIDLQTSPRSYAWPCSVFWFLCDLNRPNTFVQLDVSPGYCWLFQASQSQLVMKLPARVQPTAITVQHPLKESSVLGDISSAPRDFTVSVSLCQALGAGTECWGKAVRGTC
ncbi:uncharacterized protein LOC126035806 isoform X1 [Accipiter gentilis]|uniref:uncharacterized protein LOC126035806 isoform X1 n=1 Tax=Astur gentilis TaxID=8957 RepID=UPI0021101C0C|nr:uncharacterized protein LOC126035806 isoform X1 [Accipiter gentilis]